MVANYRRGYNLFACNGILHNHESPRRGATFVTRKITRGIAEIVATREKALYLGNLTSKRDWGFTPEYVECMWKMLQLDKPEDFVQVEKKSMDLIQGFLKEKKEEFKKYCKNHELSEAKDKQ